MAKNKNTKIADAVLSAISLFTESFNRDDLVRAAAIADEVDELEERRETITHSFEKFKAEVRGERDRVTRSLEEARKNLSAQIQSERDAAHAELNRSKNDIAIELKRTGESLSLSKERAKAEEASINEAMTKRRAELAELNNQIVVAKDAIEKIKHGIGVL